MYIVGYNSTTLEYSLVGINANTGKFDIQFPLPVHNGENSILSRGCMFFFQHF